MLRMTEEEYAAYLKRTQKQPNMAISSKDNDSDKKHSKKTKYRNHKVYVYSDGYASIEKIPDKEIIEKFDSVKEYQRCIALRLREKAGEISNLDTQTTLMIQPAFTSKDGKKHRAITYRADFTYIENGEQIVEDVKGYSKSTGKFLTTEAFRLKWKLLQARYPDYTFKLF